MPDREAALAALYAHLARARDDPARILDSDATTAADALATTTDPVTDLTAAHALGWYHWSRWAALPEGLDGDDAAAAIRYLAPVFSVSPESVPEALHHVLNEGDPAATSASDVARGQGIDLLGSYLRTGQRELLDQAVASFRATLAATTRNYPDRANDLNNLVAALCTLFERTGQLEVLREAVRAGQEAVAVAPLNDKRRARYLDNLAGSLRILAADVLGMRSSEHERLRERAPDLADQLDRVRARLDDLDRVQAALAHADAAETTRDQYRRLATERHDAHDDWERLTGRVRGLPGFADFLHTARIEQLTPHTHDGPVVFVTTSPTRGDALILTDSPADPVHVVPLAGLTQSAADEHVTRLLTACRAAGARDLAAPARHSAHLEIFSVLAWLWDTVVEPVLTHLGHTAAVPDGEPRPRVWWCPVGVVAFLPLHAAGHYRTDPTRTVPDRTVLDRVVSSYTTTVRALANARTHESDATTTVVVPVPDLPGAALPGVTDEASAISALIPDAQLLPNPTRDTVLNALPDHHIAHFACHGHADSNDPGRSHLILADHVTAPLTVTEISALKLSSGLAYLSACDTSVTAPRLADESLHITGAFYLAGYQHVVGTLWSINDRVAAEFATEFYRHLTGDGTEPPRTHRSAHALHEATRRLRDRYPDVPTVWAAYTHTGA